MLRKIYHVFPQDFRKFVTDLRKQKRNFLTLANAYGQYNSIRKERCIDRQGNPVPWYTYPAIEYLGHISFSMHKVFEFGSGYSSLWWEKRCLSLTSIESDKQWFEEINRNHGAGRKFNYKLEENETAYILSPGMKDADIVIVDGKYRSKCADVFIAACKKSEKEFLMLVFDNADWYPNTIRKIQQSLRWAQIDFHGFGPINAYTWTTSIFINPKRVQDLQYVRPLMSIAGIDNSVENLDDVEE